MKDIFSLQSCKILLTFGTCIYSLQRWGTTTNSEVMDKNVPKYGYDFKQEINGHFEKQGLGTVTAEGKRGESGA